MRPSLRVLCLVLCNTVLALNVFAEDAPKPRPSYRAVRAEKAPVLDGDLSDPAWQNAPEITGFTQRDPHEGEPATRQTRVKVVYDDDAIYFGAVMEDDAPPTPLLARRDSDLESADYLTIGIDSQHDRLSGAKFMINPSNVQADMILYNDIYDDTSWDAVWESATKTSAKGWTAEIRIPYSQLRFPEQPSYVWGFNIGRWNARLHEGSRLVFSKKTDNGYVSRFADLTGIEGIKPRRAFEVVPYGVAREDLASRNDNPFVTPSSQRMDAGVDVKYGLSSSLTLTGTINPDFGQVEVDPAVLNLSQFETFFPEKRPFFTEGGNIFNFGEGPANSRWGFNTYFPTFFYSRRIGRAPQGSIAADWTDAPGETTILGAAKVTGKLGKGWTVGAIEALTDREQAWFRTGAQIGKATVEPMTNYLVARATREYGRDSRAGFLFTSVNRRLTDNLEPTLRSNAYFGGVDGYTRFANKSWLFEWLTGTTLIEGSKEAITLAQESPARYYQRPDASHVELDPNRTSLAGFGGRAMIGKQTGHWRPNLQVMALSPGFELNDVGYLPRTDTIATHAVMQYTNTDVGKYTRERSWWIGKYQNWNFDSDNTANGFYGNWYVEHKNYWYVYGGGGYDWRAIDAQLTRGGPAAVRPKQFDVYVGAGNDSRKKFWVEPYIEDSEDELGGYFRRTSLILQYRPAPSLRLRIDPGFNRSRDAAQYVATVPDASYTPTFGNRYLFATLDQRTLDVGIRADWTATARLSMQLYVQPFIASGDYHSFKQLDEARELRYSPVDTLHDAADATYTARFASQTYDFGDPDFNFRSVRGSAVVRWEFRPGSALFVVWNENRSDVVPFGDFRFRRDLSALPGAPSQDVFLVKFSYWLPI
ncbi:MAG: carbohydrate binding family 9 domain-containing protein [Acidobacteria bacterium]|nr:carbohydrate binding family 9 domain-containing protein [Acidobacteriota bacterium]MBV9474952.1 carbohydrate binding family 9 domain-containing protein [Acidobacteriota bacterium]